MWPFASAPVPLSSGSSEHGSPSPTHLEPAPRSPPPVPTPEAEPLPNPSSDPFPERLSLPYASRASIMMTTSFISGFLLGSAQGGLKAGDRYRAMNAHRLPTTTGGWWFYHKTKNHHFIRGGVKEGVRYGAVCTGWWLLFITTEELVDRSRAHLFEDREDGLVGGQRDVGSTIIAAMTVSNLYSWKHRLDHYATARTAKTALGFSLAYGLSQDLLATWRGKAPAYIQWLKG